MSLTSKPLQQPFCTTQQAADLLGISKRTAQQWVENGLLTAWKTKGGHRRITLSSVHNLMTTPAAAEPVPRSAPVQIAPVSPAPTAAPCRSPYLIIAEDDPVFQELYRSLLPRWAMQPRLRITNNGFDALIRVGMERPDLLISDLDMPHMDGFHMLRTIRNIPELAPLAIIVVTGLSAADIDQAGGLPADIPILHKPVRFEQLEYLVEAALARHTLLRMAEGA